MSTKTFLKVRVTESELLTILMNILRPSFVFILYKVLVKMNKTGNIYHDKVFKTTTGQFFIGGTYEDMVNNRMKQEGLTPDFKSESNKVGDHVEGSKCILYNENTKRHYLQYFTFETSNLQSTYEFEGNQIDRELFRSYEIKKSTTSRQPQEKKHKPQSLMLSSILELTIDGVTYEVVR